MYKAGFKPPRKGVFMKALVIGAGSFGATIAVEMARRKCEVIVIDCDTNKLNDIKDEVGQVIVGNAKDKDLLEKFCRDVDVVFVALGEVIDASVLITHYLKELKAKRIIAKATSDDHGVILKVIGANEVVFPERDEAVRLVTSIVSPDVLDVIRLSDDFNVVQTAVPDEFVGKAIKDLDVRKKYKINVLAVKNSLTGKIRIAPSPEYKFDPDDVMITVGEMDAADDFKGKK